MTPGERVARANKANDLLRELGPAFKGVEEALVQKLKSCPLTDHALMTEIVRTIQVGEQYQKHLLVWIQDGKLADAEISAEASLMKRRKRA